MTEEIINTDNQTFWELYADNKIKAVQLMLKKYGSLAIENARLEQENKELKEKIQFHKKENSNLLAERNAAQIGYDEIREVRERYRSALEEIKKITKKYDAEVGDTIIANPIQDCYNIFVKVSEVLK